MDKLRWVFYKSDSVKQKKQVFCVKQTESFVKTDVIALRMAFIFLTYHSSPSPSFPPRGNY